MNLKEIETPALILDLELLEQNMDLMEQLLKDTGAKLRPHFKTCKSLAIVNLQLKKGAKGICCSKLSEAEVLVAGQVQDILIANQIVQPSKIKRVADLAKKTHLTVCVDHPDNVRLLSEAATNAGATIHLYIEYEIGMNRCGVRTYEEFLSLAQLIESLPGITFDGIQAYAGQLSHEEDVAYREAEVLRITKDVASLKQYVEAHGIPVKEVSGASTCSSVFTAKTGVYTEIQAGSYVYMDQALSGCSLPYHSSLKVLSTIVSKQKDGIIIDVGAKGLGMDQCAPSFCGYEHNKVSLSEEHYAIYGDDITADLGEQVLLIPGHCCTTVNLYDKLYVKKGDQIIDIWPVEGHCKSI